jgi:hypothetical protein
VTQTLNLYWLIIGLVTRFFNCIGYVPSNGKVAANEELENMWKVAVVAYLNTLSQHSSGETYENHENLQFG